MACVFQGNIAVSTVVKWAVLSRHWKQWKNIQDVKLFLIDELHLIVLEEGVSSYKWLILNCLILLIFLNWQCVCKYKAALIFATCFKY